MLCVRHPQEILAVLGFVYPGALRAYAQLTATQGSDRKEEEGQEMKFTIQFTGF